MRQNHWFWGTKFFCERKMCLFFSKLIFRYKYNFFNVIESKFRAKRGTVNFWATFVLANISCYAYLINITSMILTMAKRRKRAVPFSYPCPLLPAYNIDFWGVTRVKWGENWRELPIHGNNLVTDVDNRKKRKIGRKLNTL